MDPRATRHEGGEGHAHGLMLLADYVVDAHSGTVLEILSRTPTQRVEDTGVDETGENRTFWGARLETGVRLHDETLNVHTYDFGFEDIETGPLPGRYVVNPPVWTRAAVSAHANAGVVARFLREELLRRGVDGQGGPLVSSVNCIVTSQSPDEQQWANAAWYRNQMVYGQRIRNGKLRSYAAGLDVVAHEVFHGITAATARLRYLGQSGALDESYADIFGIIVSNHPKPVKHWDWRLGEDVDVSGKPIRDLKDPARHGQPAHMDEYAVWPAGRDYGGVHHNSGIHNRAAYRILSAVSASEAPLFDSRTGAALFYLALTNFLSRTSRFADSRAAVLLAGRTLFRNDPPGLREARLQAIADGFESAGIR